MKINKKTLRNIIIEVLNEVGEVGRVAPAAATQHARQQRAGRGRRLHRQAPAAAEPSSRVQRTHAAVEAGGVMKAEEYASLLKNTLLTTKVTPADRKKALESLFPGKGETINSLVQILSQEQQAVAVTERRRRIKRKRK
tara:strand:- start:44 stop:460 length:417 start_codon:yes stop_codon:yes gene_type:complete